MSSHWRSKKSTKYQIALHAFRKLLFHETALPPSVFFAFILLQELDLLNEITRVNWLFFTGIAFFILTLVNHYFYFSSVLTTNLGSFIPINFLLGLLGCNQKWKFLLFCFTCSYYLPMPHTQLQDLVVIVFTAKICYLTYRSLIFATQEDNKSYFSGFFTLCCLKLCTYVYDFTFNSEFRVFQKVFIVPVLILLGYAVIKIRIEKIMVLKLKEVKTPHTIILYIKTLEESFKISENINSYLFVHKQTCTNTQCYCEGYSEQSLMEIDFDRSFPISKQIINNAYIQSFENNLWSLDDRYFMMHRYVEFLMESKQYPRCINLLSHMEEAQMGYFNKCDNFVVKEKLKAQYEKEVYFDNLCHKIKYIYNYDLELGYVNKEIREILKDKVEFWGELCKESPKLNKMEVYGRKLVQRIEDLHEYFMYKIRPCEEALSFFKCTFIYSSYLIMTTNYIEFANSLTKKAQKVIEEKKSSIGYGMEYGLFLKINENGDKVKEYLFEVDITNISTSLCGLLGREKTSLVNQNVTELIPDEFKDIHCLSFDRYTRYNNFHKRDSALVGQSIDLPFKISNTQAIFLNLTTALRFDPITNSAMIECVLKKANSSTITFIMDLNGHLVYRETEAFKDLVNQPSIQNSIKKMKEEYMRTQLLEKLELKSEEEENIFGVIVSPLFCNRLVERGMKPLLKVEITSDNLRNEKIRMFDCEPTKAKETFEAGKSVQENDSQASTTSRKESIENVLTILMESSSIKIEPFLTLTLLVLAGASIIYFVLINNSFNIWETSIMENSPTFSVINLINMKSVFNLVIGYRYDVVQNYTFVESQQLANSIFIGETIQHYTTSKYLEMLIFQRDIFNGYILGINNDVILKLANLLSEEIVVKSKGLESTQIMTLQSVLINYLVSFHHLYEGANYFTLIISSSYLSEFYQKFTVIIDGLANGLQQDLHASRRNNIIFCCFFNLLLVLFIIPLWKFNVSNKKKHLKIYNLFACLEAKIIVEEIKKLERIENEIFVFSCKSNINESVQQVTSLFGINHEKQETSTKINENYDNLSKETSKINSILENIKIRKRGADLIVDGSDCDVKKIIVKDWIAILFIFVFLVILNSFFWSKLSHIAKVEEHFNLTLGTMKSLESMTIGVTNSKIFFDEYNDNNKIKFLGQDLEEWVKKWITDFEKIRMHELNKTTETVTCSHNLAICNGPFSVKLFISFLKKSISDAFEIKRAYRNSNTTEHQLNLEKSRISLTVGQQVLGKIGEIYYGWFFEEFGNLAKQKKETEIDKKQKSMVFWIFIAVFIVFSLVKTIYRKKQYVKEVTLLSILNKQMLYNNKSVESFIHRLSKSLR